MNKAKKRPRAKAVKEREKIETENVKFRNSATLIISLVTVLGMFLFILTIFVISNSPAVTAVVGVTVQIVQDCIVVSLHSLLKALSFAVQTTYSYVTIENAVIAAFLLNVVMGIIASSMKK